MKKTEMGLHPATIIRFLEQSIALHRDNFEKIKGMLSDRDRDMEELMLLQAELLLMRSTRSFRQQILKEDDLSL